MKVIEKMKNEKIRKTEGIANDENFSISFADFIQYCKDHILLLTLTIFIILLTHGQNLFYNNLGIDTQMFIEIPTFTYNWLGIGRFGLLIERYVLGLTFFSPYYASVLFILLLVLGNLLLYYTFYKISRKDFGLINLCIPLITFTSPIFVEQFIYMLQMAEITSAICLTALGTLWMFAWMKSKKIRYVLPSLVCLIISFASYQTFVGLYITFCIFGFICLFEDDTYRKETFITILKLILTFGLALLGYKILVKFLPSNSAYIDDSFYWGTHPIKMIIESIVAHISVVVKGAGNYFNLGYTIGAILCIICAIYKIWKEKDILSIADKIWYILSILALIATPFYMTIAIGHAPFIRAQFVLPFTEAFLIMFASFYLFQNKWLKYIAIILVVCVLEEQMHMTQTLYYTDQMRNDFDIQTAQELLHDIQEAGYEEKNVLAIIGHKDAQLNPVCQMGETVGVSIFTMNYNAVPYYYHSSSMILRLFKCLGYTYGLATPEQIQEARNFAKNMPVWPAKDSIQSYHDYVIVKISEDELPLE